MPHRSLPTIRSIGADVIDNVLRLGYAARFIGLTLAHADLSGFSLFEEAQYRGILAAGRVLQPQVAR